MLINATHLITSHKPDKLQKIIFSITIFLVTSSNVFVIDSNRVTNACNAQTQIVYKLQNRNTPFVPLHRGSDLGKQMLNEFLSKISPYKFNNSMKDQIQTAYTIFRILFSNGFKNDLTLESKNKKRK